MTPKTRRVSSPKSPESLVLSGVCRRPLPRLMSAPERPVRLFINLYTLYRTLPSRWRAVRLWRRLGGTARIRRGARGSPGAAPAAQRITGRSRRSLYDRGCRASGTPQLLRVLSPSRRRELCACMYDKVFRGELFARLQKYSNRKGSRG